LAQRLPNVKYNKPKRGFVGEQETSLLGGKTGLLLTLFKIFDIPVSLRIESDVTLDREGEAGSSGG
jgi:hypothetical protein